jgi:hypothetical protein
MCTSNLQVLCHYLQVKFTSAFKCSHKCSFCLIVILTVILFNLDSSFQASQTMYKSLYFRLICLVVAFLHS